MKTGIIDVRGGFRDIYGAGVLDACLAQAIRFDYCIGISAGSANLISYLSQQPRRSYAFYMEYVFRKEYASLGSWLRTRNYIDLDYSYGTLSNSDGENPIDFETLEKAPPSSMSARARSPRAIRSTSTNRSSRRTATTCSRPPARCRCSAGPMSSTARRASTAASAIRCPWTRRLPTAATGSC